jgi:hypothetical protein
VVFNCDDSAWLPSTVEAAGCVCEYDLLRAGEVRCADCVSTRINTQAVIKMNTASCHPDEKAIYTDGLDTRTVPLRYRYRPCGDISHLGLCDHVTEKSREFFHT